MYFKKTVLLLGSALVLLMALACPTSKNGTLPIGYVDTKPDSTVTGGSRLSFQGWAISEDGISKVCLFTDRRLVKCTEEIGIGTGRPDVQKAYPAVSGASKSGWLIEIDSNDLLPGSHEFLIQAASKKGSSRDIGAINVNVVK